MQLFGHTIPLEVACKMYNGEEWHQVMTPYLVAMTGLSDQPGSNSAAVKMPDLPDMSVKNGADSACAWVPDMFSCIGMCEVAKGGGVLPSSVQAFFCMCKPDTSLYNKALLAIKELQKLWRTIYPKYCRVLLFPVVRQVWMVHLLNCAFRVWQGEAQDQKGT